MVSVGALAASSCAGVVQVNEYGDALKKNFVTACTTSVSIKDNKTQRTDLAPVSAPAPASDARSGEPHVVKRV